MAQIAASQCTNLATAPGFYLRDDAAQAWDRAVTAYGKPVLLTGAWRSYEIQERIFRERYRPGASSPFGDYRRWNGQVWGRVTGAAAAVPGTSNHGGGIAVDVKTSRSKGDAPYPQTVVFGSFNDADRLAFLRVAADHGWRDAEGRSVGEHWHLTYYPEHDKHRGARIRFPKRGELGLGSKGADVERVQVLLNQRLSGPNLTPDGDYGVGTAFATARFQRENGLSPVGVVGPATLRKLEGSSAKPSAPKPAPPKKDVPVYLKRGTKKADQVKILQRFLREAFPRQFGKGAAHEVVVDGDYGARTEYAVKFWQEKAGLAPTGEIGPKSVARLTALGVDL
jgi:peptidoglycan hydrolase-like protein with peptidoglycan-binding domain